MSTGHQSFSGAIQAYSEHHSLEYPRPNFDKIFLTIFLKPNLPHGRQMCNVNFLYCKV